MRVKALLPAIWAVSALVAVLLAVVLWLVPGADRLNEELAQARGEVPRRRAQLATLVGPSYEKDLAKGIERAKLQRAELEGDLQTQTRRLEAWFPHAERVGDVPARDRFGAAYTFHQDELRRLITEVAGVKRRKIGEVPLVKPEFLDAGRDPKDTDEMRAIQRVANLESTLLQAAAKAGGFPTKVTEFQEGWRSVSARSPFQESSVLLHLAVEARELHGLLKALCELKGEGPVVRIEQLSTRPLPLPARMEAADVPLIEADVRVIVSTYRGS